MIALKIYWLEAANVYPLQGLQLVTTQREKQPKGKCRGEALLLFYFSSRYFFALRLEEATGMILCDQQTLLTVTEIVSTLTYNQMSVYFFVISILVAL